MSEYSPKRSYKTCNLMQLWFHAEWSSYILRNKFNIGHKNFKAFSFLQEDILISFFLLYCEISKMWGVQSFLISLTILNFKFKNYWLITITNTLNIVKKVKNLLQKLAVLYLKCNTLCCRHIICVQDVPVYKLKGLCPTFTFTST